MSQNLEQRFNAMVAKLYGGVKVLDSQSTAGDTVEAPRGAVNQDKARLSKYLKSPAGLKFINLQNSLQQLNTFAETRVINDGFVIDNLVPFTNKRRSNSSQVDNPIMEQGAGIASFNEGHAGRLQQESSDSAITRAFHTPNIRGTITSLFSASRLGSLLRTKQYAIGNSLGVDERPETKINGNDLYPVVLWKGSSIEDPLVSDLKNVLADNNIHIPSISQILDKTHLPNYLTGVGNSSVVNSITSKVTGLFGRLPQSVKSTAVSVAKQAALNAVYRNGLGPVASLLQNNPFLPQGQFQQLYFITDRNEANNKSYLNAAYKTLGPQDPYTLQIATTDGSVAQQISLDTFRPSDAELLSRKERSLVSRYSARHISSLVESLATYRTLDKKNIGALSREERKEIGTRGIVGGIDMTTRDKENFPAADMNSPNFTIAMHSIAQRAYYVDGTETRIGFLSDTMNQSGILAGNVKGPVTDFVKFKIYDVHNKKTIPLRCTILDLTENIEAQYQDSETFIGRIEENITYMAARRSLNFSFYVYALSAAELNGVWEKINYITGLAYPSAYSDGFMIAPFTRLTIGDVWVNQPGYFTSISHTFDNNIPWEVTEKWQKPHGIKVTVTFKILEKSQMSTSSPFHHVSPDHPATQANMASVLNQKPTIQQTISSVNSTQSAIDLISRKLR